MSGETKISASQLERQVCLYIRQSSLAQVQEHQESTRRQYALQQRALALGWSERQIVLIDEDLGQSASDASRCRAGYQRLLQAIVSGSVGAILSLEVSRLARQDSEGHRLVELAALMEIVLIDETQVYDPNLGDDRLLLGLKVLLSSNEIRLMHQRLQENKVRKAQRGQLRLSLPIGLVNLPAGGVSLDPDEQVQGAVRLVFERFRLSGYLTAVVRYFQHNHLLFPRRHGNWDGELEWGPLSIQRTRNVLTNPLYAGAYVYGRTERKIEPAGAGQLRRRPQALPMEDWQAVDWQAFQGYIDRQEYESNQQRLLVKARRPHRQDGPALLSQVLLCGRCGRRMYVSYNGDGGRYSTYVCATERMRYGQAQCQRLPAPPVDRAVSQRLLAALSPVQLELSLAAWQELERQQQALHQQWQRRLEGSRYAVHLAQRRYEQVEPENRLVVRQLEKSWNEQLLTLEQLEDQYQQFCQRQPVQLSAEQQQRLLALAQDFPQLWLSDSTTWAERKTLLELLIADVTLTRHASGVALQIRWHTNQVEQLCLPLPVLGSPKTPARIVERIRQLSLTHTDQQIAVILNQEGIHTAYDNPFTERKVADTRRRNQIRKG